LLLSLPYVCNLFSVFLCYHFSILNVLFHICMYTSVYWIKLFYLLTYLLIYLLTYLPGKFRLNFESYPKSDSGNRSWIRLGGGLLSASVLVCIYFVSNFRCYPFTYDEYPYCCLSVCYPNIFLIWMRWIFILL